MNFSEQGLSITEAKEMDMVDYLSKLGHDPAKIKNEDYWYLSPLRDENTPSFKVNRKINRWYDHGMGKGGNLVDFGILYHKCTVSEFLQKMEVGFSFQKPIVHFPVEHQPEHKITILHDFCISSFALLKYLEQRKIQLEIAEQFCREVRYDLNEKIYYGIGFKNDAGGYEIRNPYFKASSSPKGISTFSNGSKEVSVFEGFTDFLSFMAIHQKQPKIDTDFVILNSVSFFEKARAFMEQHEVVRLYLDRDSAGQNYSRYALSLNNNYKDESKLYKGYKDLNEWLMKSGNNQKKHFRQKLR